MLKYYHYIAGHKNYHILYDKIISKGYYCNELVDSCKDYVKNCTNLYQKINLNFYSQ